MNAPATRTTAMPAFEWAVVLAVPALAILVGAIALPRPSGADAERSAIDRTALADVVHTERPKGSEPLDEVLGGGKLRIVGVELPRGPVAPGDRYVISTTFKVESPLDRDWKLFLHVDARGGRFRIHGDHFPADGKYPSSSWQKGEFVTDRYEGKIPLDAPAGEYEAFLGLYIGDERMPVTGGTRHDGENRVRLGRLRVE